MKNNIFDAPPGFTPKGQRVDPMDDIFQQARQGSVAAIIQVLNEKLANSGIRTRAVLDRGILQLLCEAEQERQLEQTPLVEKVTSILEAIAPRNIRRVNINSRLVREQQLLWLEEIQQDPEGQLLWSELIVLKKPGLLQQWSNNQQAQSPRKRKTPLPNYTPSQLTREQRQFRRGIIGGAIFSTVLVLAGLGVMSWWRTPNDSNAQNQPVVETNSPASPDTNAPETPNSAPSSPAADSFAQAVRLAQAAANEGLTAQTEQEWLALAQKWQEASDLMAQVSASDDRYQIAQDRTVRYQENSQAAQREAEKLR
ncbi:hypothetical protein [Roseofilum capinflatum]|uniref:Uncharacterized protein n=1 Tax=Roseofilum capinflatum BLCC-M114 TaxID=3022440 RepID=A0ABT7BCD2_9CYAN|nr:hypothetical protein [Roseofilum capinflatum]MDJ1176850.1 hypothetical protein [Roseofilum capinflatum BLCC-M114]